MAKYLLNPDAVTHARELIDKRQYVLDSDWGAVQPSTEAQKARYAFAYGDLRRVHRSGLIACVYRAAEWRHKDVELAAHDLLQYLDAASG